MRMVINSRDISEAGLVEFGAKLNMGLAKIIKRFRIFSWIQCSNEVWKQTNLKEISSVLDSQGSSGFEGILGAT